MSKRLVLLAAFTAILRAATTQGAGVAETAHNLSASGPGPVRSPAVSEICVFCHTPHRAGVVPLWNRELRPITYKLYESSTLKATPKQPTGASRLCLSCHDGTTALGNVRVPPRSGPIGLGRLTGSAVVGTDLSDDHPISFVFDADLARDRRHLAEPARLPQGIGLDATGQVQCTTCHDAHSDKYRKFLRVDDRRSALCTGCHTLSNWDTSAHATSPASLPQQPKSPWRDTPFTTVADNGCENCHQTHSAPRPPRLIRSADESRTCLVCHDGTITRRNIEAEISKPSRHPVYATNWTHDPAEDPRTMARHVTCVDCHNPHQSAAVPAPPPAVSGRLRGVAGLRVSGTPVPDAQAEYEVCFKCHGVGDQTTPGIVRSDNIRNVRLAMSPGNPSYHPVASTGRNTLFGGFEPDVGPGRLIRCTDCHDNDEWTAAGSAPRGSHGSRYTPILAQNYDTNTPTMESFESYALCYKCHTREFVIGDSARTFPHRRHVVDARTPCAACHDAHGSRQNVRLINFMLIDRTGKTVVSPSLNQRRLEFVSFGVGRGQCYLMCHGKNHEPATYPR